MPIKYGKAKGSLWEQTFLFGMPFRIKGFPQIFFDYALAETYIIGIHNLGYKVNPQYFKTPYTKISQWCHKLQYHFAWQFRQLSLIVSEYFNQWLTFM